MSIRIATAPVSWGVMEVEGWGGQKTYAEVLDEMVEAGYRGTELGPWGFLPTGARRLREELGRRSLALVGAFVPMNLPRPECHEAGFQAAMETARLLSEAGAPVIVLADALHPSRMAVAGAAVEERDGMSAGQWAAAASLLERTARAVRESGLRAVFHHHAGTFVETPAEVDRLLEMTEPALLGLCLDTGHYYYGGGDPADAAARHAGRIWHLHLKDVRPGVLETARKQRTGYLDAVRQGVFCELGAGGVDVPAVIRALAAAGFDGWAVYEQDVDPARPDIDPKNSAARSREYLRRATGL